MKKWNVGLEHAPQLFLQLKYIVQNDAIYLGRGMPCIHKTTIERLFNTLS